MASKNDTKTVTLERKVNGEKETYTSTDPTETNQLIAGGWTVKDEKELVAQEKAAVEAAGITVAPVTKTNTTK